MNDSKFNEEEASWGYAEVWDKFPVPARPSAEELQYLEAELKPLGSNAKVLILGSTIEYRSLCKKLNIAPYVADFDRTIYQTLTNYSKEKFEKETFFEVDWLEINDEDKYDAIIGHRGANVIGKEMLGRFFQRLHRALKQGGIFYSKNNVLPENYHDDLESLVEKWAFKKDRLYPLFSYIEVALYIHCADKDGYVDYAKARNLVDSWLEKGSITPQDYDAIKILISMSDDARFRGILPSHELQAAIDSAGFSSVEWHILDKDICSNMPIIKMVK